MRREGRRDVLETGDGIIPFDVQRRELLQRQMSEGRAQMILDDALPT